MKRSSRQSARSSTILNRLTSVVSLARWRWRRQRFLLLLTGLGMLAAVVLACILPLLTLVLQTTELHDILTASPSAAELTLHTQTIGLSSQTLNVINAFGNSPFQNDLAPYLQGQPRLEIQTPEFSIIAPEQAQLRTPLRLYGNPINASTSHVILKQGRLPNPTSQNIEIALTPDTASALHVTVGSVITVVSNFSTIPVRGTPATAFQETFCSIVPGKDTTSMTSQNTYCQRFKLDVVGIFDVKTNDYFWHGEDFQPQSHDTRTHYAALASNQALLAALDSAAANHGADTVYFLAGYYGSLSWYYYLDPSLVSLNNLDDLIEQLSTAQETVNQASSFALGYQLPLVKGFDLQGSVLSNYAVPSSLENFRSRIAIARIPIFILTLQIICLLLFFIGIMIELLIERQSNAIALLRSRGASIGQIFGSHITQALILCVLALIAGPLLAYIGAVSIAQLVLPSTNHDALKVITTDPVTALWNVRWYALVIAGAIVVVLLAALYRASRIHVSAQRRESGQIATQPLWQRLNLDLIAAIIALTGYGIALYLADIGGLLDAQTQALVSAPLQLVAPIFLLLAAVLLFLRVTPLLLRLASRLLVRGRGVVPMLAITQLSRSPRQSVRMIMLLALATAFAMFILIFAASQAQRATNLAAYSAGADFSGSIPSTAPSYPINIETQRYRNIRGVLAASVGEVVGENVGNIDNLFPLEVKAIDPGTFAQATIWNSQNSSQPLSTLLAQLAAQRKQAIQQPSIPAIVDAYTWNKLGLHVGESFFVHQNGTLTDNVRYIAIAEVQSIPTLTNLDIVANQQLGNMIVDYQTFSAIEQRLYGFEPPANYVWLHTSNDPAAVARVRSVLQSSILYLDDLQDRRTLINTIQTDPLYLNLIIVLILGVVAALILGLIGDLLASWLSVRSRLNQFVALRALGATFRQITGIMICEQGLIYLVALCLGIVFGVLLAVTVVPTLLFSTPPGTLGGTNSVIITIVQQLLPAQIVFPWSLGVVFAVLLMLCIAAVMIMARVALQPSMSSTLRLDEDQPPLAVLREESGRRLALPTRTPSHRAGLSFMILAFGQIRRTWLLLVTTGIGIIAAIVMVCAIPLFSEVMTTAGLQTTLNSVPGGSEFTLDALAPGLSTPVTQNIQQELDPYLQAHIGSYVHRPSLFSIVESGFTYTRPGFLSNSFYPLNLFATSIEQASPHLTLLQGRLPRETSDVLEVLLTAPTAQNLHVKVGSTLQLQFRQAAHFQDVATNKLTPASLEVRVVGLFKANSVNDYIWHGNTLQAIPGNADSAASVIVPITSFLAAFDHRAATLHTNAVFTANPFELLWDYRLDISQIAYSQFSDLANRLTSLQDDVQNKYGSIGSTSFPYLIQASVYDPVYGSFTMVDVLESYLNRVDVFRVPAAILALEVIGLILVFISLMADILVERQAQAIALLRSRGASGGQIAATLITQGIGVGVIALIVGPPLALVVVSAITLRLLGPQAPGTLHLVMSNPMQAILGVIWYALATALVVILALALLFRRAASMNILSLRRETARSSSKTAWQHLRLDGGAAIIALTAFGLSLYLIRLGNQLDLGTKTLVLAPLTIVASIFFVFAVMVLFLRFFPLLLRLGIWIVVRGRGAVSMLALTQMARSPRYTLRTILLPAFAIAFVIFTLVFNASQIQRIIDISNYEVGTDFSGDIPPDADNLTLQDEMAIYGAIPGVTSVTVGYTTRGFASGSYPSIPVQVMAVDAATFGHTAIWSSQNSSQSLSSLMNQLLGLRTRSINGGSIPVIVDAAAANRLHLAVGTRLSVVINNQTFNPMYCQVVAIVQHIPSINNNTATGSADKDTSPVGLLMDYQTYFKVYEESSKQLESYAPPVAPGPPTPFNHIWLRTLDTPTAISQVRAALQTKYLYLDNLFDRHALIDELNNDPLYRNLTSFFILGTITALLLALLGDILASWLSVRMRLTQFVVFRSLGAAPRQVVGMLTWEQGIVHTMAILLGGVFGTILAITAIPALIIVNIPADGSFGNVTNAQFYTLQQVVPAHVIIPSSLSIILLALLSIVAIVLITMIWISLRPSPGHALRLSED